MSFPKIKKYSILQRQHKTLLLLLPITDSVFLAFGSIRPLIRQVKPTHQLTPVIKVCTISKWQWNGHEVPLLIKLSRLGFQLKQNV